MPHASNLIIISHHVTLDHILYDLFQTYRKELFVSVHFFVHLNLAIALLLGYILFIAGIDTAVENRVRNLIIISLELSTCQKLLR